jgi:hypothetical protein
MFALATATIVCFITFDALMRRTMADGEEEGEPGITSLALSTKMVTATAMVIDVAINAIAVGGKEGSMANSGRRDEK